MSARNRQRTHFDNAYLGNAKLLPPSLPIPAGSVLAEHYGLPMLRSRFLLAGQTISIAAANDFGGRQLADLPNKNLLIAGAMIDAAFSVAGFAVNTGAAMNFALGTVTAIATTLNGADANLIDIEAGVGATADGTIKIHSFDNTVAAPALTFLDASATLDLFLNAASAVTSGTGVITFTGGHVDLFYFDMNEVAA